MFPWDGKTLRAKVAPQVQYPLVLGIRWLCKHMLRIDWSEGSIWLENKLGKQHVWRDDWGPSWVAVGNNNAGQNIAQSSNSPCTVYDSSWCIIMTAPTWEPKGWSGGLLVYTRTARCTVYNEKSDQNSSFFHLPSRQRAKWSGKTDWRKLWGGRCQPIDHRFKRWTIIQKWQNKCSPIPAGWGVAMVLWQQAVRIFWLCKDFASVEQEVLVVQGKEGC